MRIDYRKVMSLKELFFTTAIFNGVDFASCLTLHHYTNAESLKYIVKESYVDLRFTQADRFNSDPNEGMHVINVFKKVCEKAVANHSISREFFDLLIKVINGFNTLSDEYRQRYVFFFSKIDHGRQDIILDYSDNKYLHCIINVDCIYHIDEL